MPLKLHCIFNQPSVLPDIIKLVEKTAHKLNSKKKSAKVEDVYAELRDNGFEIDAESVAYAYQNTKGMVGRKNFSSQADLNRFGSAGIKKSIEIANKGDITKARLGNLGVSGSVARGIANTFATLNNRNDVDKSRLFQLQEALKKAANSMLDKSAFAKKPKATFTETLNDYFDIENIQKTSTESMKGRVKGNISSMDEIWDAVKNDIEIIKKGIKDKGERAAFETMTDAIVKSSYDILLSTKQVDDVIKGVIKQIGYTKEANSKQGKIEVIDWNKVLSNQEDWKNEFYNALRNNGFDSGQIGRILAKMESNYDNIIQQKSLSKLNEIKKGKSLNTKSDPDAVERIIKLKNAGIFLPKNSDYLREAFGSDIPQEIADQVKSILDDYEDNIRDTGNISNVEAEEIVRAVRNLLSPLGKNAMEKTVDGISDYMGLRSSSTISTLFNATQNVTSGINAAILPTITAVARTRNPKIIIKFIKSWINTFKDVAMGGVTIRDAKTVNVLEQLQGRGGLSDRWNFDNAKGFFGYTKAVLNFLGQVTATAADAANGTVIYDAEIIKSVKSIFKQRGMSGRQANEAIDDIIFGKAQNGKTNRQVWYEEAVERLENQEGVVNRKAKARRIADELIWHKLVTDYNITVNEIKSIQSASLSQKSKNLGHEADGLINPSIVLTGFSRLIGEQANEAKKKGDRSKYIISHLMDTVFRTMNMFIGGKANWAILALQNSPFGVAQGLFDVVIAEIGSKKGEVPLYRQELAEDNPDHLRDQLAARKAIYGRFERGVYGTFIQALSAWAIISIMSAGDDDDEKSRRARIKRSMDRLVNDPNTSRMMDKAMPTILASELAYAFDKETGELDEDKISNSYFLPKYMQSFRSFAMYAKDQIFQTNQYDKLQESLYFNRRIKDPNDRAESDAESVMRYVGNLVQIPYISWFNVEKNEFKVITSGFQPDDEQRDKVKAEFKEKMSNINGATDAFLDGMGINTLIDLFK